MRLGPMNGSAQVAGLLCRGKKLFPKTRLLEGLPKPLSSAPHPGVSSFSLAITRGKGNSAVRSGRLVREMLTCT